MTRIPILLVDSIALQNGLDDWEETQSILIEQMEQRK
jgi:hypothetical protein